MDEEIYKVKDPDGNLREIKGPSGASDDEVIAQAKFLFGSTTGGAALGNPNLTGQGSKPQRQDILGSFEKDIADIGGAGIVGGALGAAAPELLSGGGKILGSLPYPAARTIGGGMEAAGQTLKAAGRAAPAIAGAVSGIGSEVAGKAAEAVGADPVTAEVARIAGGGVSGETINAATTVLRKYALTPALGLISKFKHETAKVILEKLEGASVPLTTKEADFVNGLISEIRGGEKTDKPLEAVGSIMGERGKQVLGQADNMMIDAVRKGGSVGAPSGYPSRPQELADVGASLRDTIAKRNEAALADRATQYAANEKLRDSVVKQMEDAGKYVSDMPEYQQLLDGLKTQLTPGARSPSVQAGYQKMVSELEVPEELKKTTMKGGISFQALDDVRRKLGDVFRGQPAEGYEAIGETAAKDLYNKVSDIQKKFAGPAQAKLLEDYASQTKGLDVFTSKTGKKATALDQYREEQYATDPSLLPSSFFKTRASIQALKELTGNPAQVSAAALSYADRELEGKNSAEIRSWMTKNNEWLTEVPATLGLVRKYAVRLEDAERSLKSAQDFTKQATKDSALLTRQSLPAQRAVDLIRSGDTEMWNHIAPAIAKSPQAKKQMVDAVRQVIGDAATAESTANMFSRNIRPFLEKAAIATKSEMDFISKKLADIQSLNIPEPERLGMAKRILFNSIGGWSASAASRTGMRSMAYAIPD